MGGVIRAVHEFAIRKAEEKPLVKNQPIQNRNHQILTFLRIFREVCRLK